MTDEATPGAEAPASGTITAAQVMEGVETQAETPDNDTSGGQPGDDAAAQAEDEGEDGVPQEPGKPKKTPKERIAELTWRAKEAERREQALLDRLAKPAEPEPKAAAPEPPAGGRPDPAKFADGIYDPDYVEALTDWKVGEALKKSKDDDASERAASEARTTRQTRIAAAVEKHPDFSEVVVEGANKGAWKCSPVMANAMASTEADAEIAYHLAKNPAEAARIFALDPISQVREIGKIEAALTPAAAPPSTPPKIASDAPAPPADRARGQSGKFTVPPDTDDFAAFERQHFGKA